MSAETFQCPHCTSEISTDATKCPECGGGVSAAVVYFASAIVAALSLFGATVYPPAAFGVFVAGAIALFARQEYTP